MKFALVTGGSGYLGSHMCKLLKKNGWKVAIYDIKQPDHPYHDLVIQKDVCNINDLYDLFDEINFDIVFHFAGRIEVGDSIKNPTEFYRVNVGGTCNVLNAMVEYGVKNIIYSSTAGVYKPKDELIKETDATDWTNNPYAGSKLSAEQSIRHSGLNYIIFRYFNLAGASPDGDIGENHFPETHLIPRILQNINNFHIYGKDYSTPDGTCIRDYVHVDDVANAHLQAAERLLTGKQCHTINLGTGKGYSVKEIVNLVEKITGQRITYQFVPRREGDPNSLVADSTIAKNILYFEPKYDIISMIETAYNWHLKYDNQY